MAKELFENYITAVTSHVKFRFDRYDIGQELREHMEDLYEDLLSQDIDEEQAAQLTVDYMGDSEELGKELNKAHNPVLGDADTNLFIDGVVIENLVHKFQYDVFHTDVAHIDSWQE